MSNALRRSNRALRAYGRSRQRSVTVGAGFPSVDEVGLPGFYGALWQGTLGGGGGGTHKGTTAQKIP